MTKKYEITEEEFEVILKAIKGVLGNPSGCINDGDFLKCSTKSGNGTSMCWDTFKEALRREFIIRN